MHAGRKRAVWLVAALAAVLLCAASGHHVFCRTRTIAVSSSDGGRFLITPASLREAINGRKGCKIAYRKGTNAGEVLLAQHFLDCEPSLLVASTNGTDLLCLYSTDTHLCLLKIIPQQSSKPFKANSDLAWIVQSSFCAIESGDFREWKEVQDFLRNAPQEQYRRQTVWVLRLGTGRYERRGLLESVDEYIERLQPTRSWFGW